MGRHTRKLLMNRVPAGTRAGGRFAPSVRPDEMRTSTKKLPSGDGPEEKVIYRIAGTTTTLRKDANGVWAPTRHMNQITWSPLARKMEGMEHTKQEVKNYSVPVICEMLNDGDIPSYSDFLAIAGHGVKMAGRLFGGEGAWHHITEPTIDSTYHTYKSIVGMAQAKTIKHLYKYLGEDQIQPHVLGRSNYHHPDKLISYAGTLDPRFYKGEDGKMLERYAEQTLTEGGPRLLSRNVSSCIPRQQPYWIAIHLLATKDTTDPLFQDSLGLLEDIAIVSPEKLRTVFYVMAANTGFPTYEPHVSSASAISALDSKSPLRKSYEKWLKDRAKEP